MAITREEVERVAALARLRLEPAEVERLTADLGHILDAFTRLGQLDTTGVEPTAHVGSTATPMRADEPSPSLPREAALANAPKQQNGAFVVPKTVDTGI
jgi:aspartyl-tRNA(Asn)/glutamyl-tRNA(Gln) amidotransferase subunit C